MNFSHCRVDNNWTSEGLGLGLGDIKVNEISKSVQNELVHKNILNITLFYYLIPYDKVVENTLLSYLHLASLKIKWNKNRTFIKFLYNIKIKYFWSTLTTYLPSNPFSSGHTRKSSLSSSFPWTPVGTQISLRWPGITRNWFRY